MDSELTILHVESLIVPQPVEVVFHHLADRFNELPDWNKSFLRIEGPPSFQLKEGTVYDAVMRAPYSFFRRNYQIDITKVIHNQQLTFELPKGSFLPVWDFYVEEITLERTRVTHAIFSRQQSQFFHKIRLPMLRDRMGNHIPKVLLEFKRRMESVESKVFA